MVYGWTREDFLNTMTQPPPCHDSFVLSQDVPEGEDEEETDHEGEDPDHLEDSGVMLQN